MKNLTITIDVLINIPTDTVWTLFTEPEHIKHWYFASADWHAPDAEVDLRVGGKFKIKMSARDGSMGFDFEGVYTDIERNKTLCYELGDSRRVEISFEQQNGSTKITESFEAEDENTAEMQRAGWQAILDNFKRYAETSE
jgi:uncharacterized protein YndB with AHSA1/START domain